MCLGLLMWSLEKTVTMAALPAMPASPAGTVMSFVHDPPITDGGAAARQTGNDFWEAYLGLTIQVNPERPAVTAHIHRFHSSHFHDNPTCSRS